MKEEKKTVNLDAYEEGAVIEGLNKIRTEQLEKDGSADFVSDLMLAMAIDNTKADIQNMEDKLAQLNYALNNSQGAMKKLDFYYDQFRGWAEEFEDASLEQRKMIACQLIREINVSRGYGLDIVFNVTYEQFFSV